MAKYGEHIKIEGTYPKEIAQAMGKHFYFATFDDVDSALQFKDYVLETL